MFYFLSVVCVFSPFFEIQIQNVRRSHVRRSREARGDNGYCVGIQYRWIQYRSTVNQIIFTNKFYALISSIFTTSRVFVDTQNARQPQPLFCQLTQLQARGQIEFTALGFVKGSIQRSYVRLLHLHTLESECLGSAHFDCIEEGKVCASPTVTVATDASGFQELAENPSPRGWEWKLGRRSQRWLRKVLSSNYICRLSLLSDPRHKPHPRAAQEWFGFNSWDETKE